MIKKSKPEFRPLEELVVTERGADFDGTSVIEYSELLKAHYPDHEVGIIRAVKIYFGLGELPQDLDGVLAVFHSIEDGTRDPQVQNNETI